MPFPGTAITWTDGNATDWVISAFRVLPTPNCGVASGNCYRIGAGGTWATGANWSNTSGGATCSCTPVATNDVIFNATPTGTTTLAAATTIASIDMTGFTGTLDTTASNWALTVNGPFAIQGTFQARSSTIAVTGDVDVLTAGTIVNLGASSWTVNGLWTNLSTSASWAAGTSTVTIRDPASGTLTFAALAGGTNEFNNLTLDASVTPSITYTMAVNALRMGATLTIRNSTGGATGPTILTTSNLGITAGSLAVATLGSLAAKGSAFVGNGNVSVTADDRARNGQSRPDRRRTQRRQWRDPYRQRFHSHRVERGDDRGNERNDHAHYQLVHEHRQLGHEWRRLRVHEGHEHGDDERCGQHRDSECEQQLQQPGHLGGGSGHPNRPRRRLRNLDGECRLNPGEQHLHADRGRPRSEHGGWDHWGRGGHENHFPPCPPLRPRVLPL